MEALDIDCLPMFAQKIVFRPADNKQTVVLCSLRKYKQNNISPARSVRKGTTASWSLGWLYVLKYFTKKRYNNNLPHAVQFYGVNFVLFVEMSKHSK